MSEDQCDVLIVGAGPVGLLLALILHKHGVRVIIVERQRALYPLPRAVSFDHESRRLFGSVGLNLELERILQQFVFENGGENGVNFVWRDADMKLIVDLHLENPTMSGYPSLMTFNQPEVESLLEEVILKRGIRLIRGFALRSLEQYDDRVEAGFSQARTKEMNRVENGVYNDGPPTAASQSNGHHSNGHQELGLDLSASYVVGCDGANSTVRRLQGFTVTDLDSENDWLIMDLVPKNGYKPPRIAKIGSAQVCDPKRPTTVVCSGTGRQRLEFMRIPGESKEDLIRDEKAWELLKPWGYSTENCELERKVIYTFQAKWANEFYKDRVMLAGDALHLMPPFIGQGLNSGFRDAGALGWRLPLILKGLSKREALLQSYENERKEHVLKLTKQCVLLGDVICETDPVKSKSIHTALRDNPPEKVYDPPLGQPGTLTSQDTAGHLSLHRKLYRGDSAKQAFFDDIHGYGWQLLTFGDESAESLLSEESRRFFVSVLNGKSVNISEKEDVENGYRNWFTDQMGIDHVVLVRPDFYVFGHAPLRDVDRLVHELREKMSLI